MTNLKDLINKAVQAVSQTVKIQASSSPSVSASDFQSSFASQDNNKVIEDTLSLFDEDVQTQRDEELRRQQEALRKEQEQRELEESRRKQEQKEQELAEKELEEAEQEAQKQTMATEQEISDSYEAFISKLQAAGLKTTGLREGEVNFAEYAAALSDEVKAEIINSFDCEADYILQQEIAALFRGDNDMKNSDFISALKAAGYEVERGSVKTSYIIDDKKSAAEGGGQLTDGAITIITIRDPQTGAEIKIVDSNGNGAIEVEELFMNELLTGISSQIDTSNFQRFNGIHIGASSGVYDGSLDLQKAQSESEDTENSAKKKISANDYRKMLAELTQQYLQEQNSNSYTTFGYKEANEKARNYMEQNYVIDSSASSKIKSNLKVA